MEEDKEKNEGEEPQKPKKLSVKATILLVFVALVMLFLIVMTIRGCSISKKVNSGSNEQSSNSVSLEPSESPTNSGGFGSDFSQNTLENEGSEPSPVESSTSPNEPISTTEQIPNVDSSGFTEVADVVLSEQRTTAGMVIGKHVYARGNSYIYGINISLIVGDDTITAEYFCPRRTFEELKSSDYLEVVYQMDSNGGVSVYSISRG